MLCITSNFASMRSYYVTAPAGWINPLSTAGCILWLDCDSLYSDIAMTTLCNNNDNVRGWFDKSASANHATNSSSAFTCLTNHSSFNGKSVFNYPSATSNSNIGLLFTQPTLLPYNNSTCTIFIVFLTSNASNSSMMLSIGPGSGHRQINTSGGICYMDKNGGAMVNSGASSITLNKPYITCFTSGTTQNGYRNGNIFSTTGSSTQFATGTPTGRVGSNINNITTDGIRGAIAEIIIYNTILSSANRAIVENYLISKYAFPDVTTGLLLYYKMTTASFSTNLKNEVSGSYDGTCTSITTMSSTYPSPIGDGSYLNLTTSPAQYVTLPAFNLTSYAQGISLSFWFLKLSTLVLNARFLQFISPANNGYLPGGASGSIVASYLNSTSTYTTATQNMYTGLSNNTWYHCVYTTNSTVSKFYLNGVVNTFSGSAPGNFLTTLTGITSGIGRNTGTSALNNFGCCEYRIYDKALSQSEVDALYAYRP